MVPPVWYLNGRSTFLCTMKFGRRATGGTSVIWATLMLHYKETAETMHSKQRRISGGGGVTSVISIKEGLSVSSSMSSKSL